jgi:hypothetical protein
MKKSRTTSINCAENDISTEEWSRSIGILNSEKVVIFIVAYNAERHLESLTLKKFIIINILMFIEHHLTEAMEVIRNSVIFIA